MTTCVIANILADFFTGIFDSLRIHRFIVCCVKQRRMCAVYLKVLACILAQWLVEIVIANYAMWLHSFFAMVFCVTRILYTIDIINCGHASCQYPASGQQYSSMFASIVLTWSMEICCTIVDNIFAHNMWIITDICKIMLMCVLHGIYTFNAYWHYRGIDLQHQIVFYEIMWPYFVGYGAVLAVLRLAQCMVGYNILLAIMIIMPFITHERKPLPRDYPAINFGVPVAITARVCKIMLRGIRACCVL